MSRRVPDGERWTAVYKGHKNGILILLLTLLWWKKSTVEGSSERADFLSAVEDVAWVVGQLVNLSPTSSALTPPASKNTVSPTSTSIKETVSKDVGVSGASTEEDNTTAGPMTRKRKSDERTKPTTRSTRQRRG